MREGRVRVGLQGAQQGGVQIDHGMTDDARALHTAIIPIISQAALVAPFPESQIGKMRPAFHVVGQGEPLPRAERTATGTQATCAAICRPETVTIAPAGSKHEPAIENHEVLTALPPGKGASETDGVQVNQEQGQLVLFIEACQDIGRMQVIVANAGVVHAGHEVAEFTGQALAQARLPWGGHAGEPLHREDVQLLSPFQSARDEDAFPGSEEAALFAQRQWDVSRQAMFGHASGAFIFHPGLAGPDQLTNSANPIGDEIALHIKVAVRKVDPVDDSVWALLDHACLPIPKPFVEAQTGRPQQDVAEFGATHQRNPPADASTSGAERVPVTPGVPPPARCGATS